MLRSLPLSKKSTSLTRTFGCQTLGHAKSAAVVAPVYAAKTRVCGHYMRSYSTAKASSELPSSTNENKSGENSRKSESESQSQNENQKKEQKKPILSLEDYGAHLKNFDMTELLTASFVYKCCTMKWLVDVSPKLIGLANNLNMGWMSNAIVKQTFFKIFCAGENKPEVEASMRKLHNAGINSILDLSIESDMDTSSLIITGSGETVSKPALDTSNTRIKENKRADFLVKEYMFSIDMASSQPDSFAAIKVTGLIPPAALYRLSLSYMTLHRTFTDAFQFLNIMKMNYSQFVDSFILKLPSFGNSKVLSDNTNAYLKQVFDLFDTNNDGLVDQCDIEIGLNLDNKLSRKLYLSDEIDIIYAYKEQTAGFINSKAAIRGAMPSDFEDYDLLTKRIAELSAHAKELNVQLMIDAEHSYFQPIIDQVTLGAMNRFNSYKTTSKSDKSSDYFLAKPVVFNTYQMYTKSGLSRLMADFEKSSRQNWAFGAKLVRGAYLEQERDIAQKLGYISPINESLANTHLSYNNGVKFVLSQLEKRQKEFDAARNVPKSKGKDQGKGQEKSKPLVRNPSLFVASHNYDSIELALGELTDRGISSDARVVSFAQLLGMQDAVSYKLAELGMNIYKYVPYGPIEETLPYLVRRAQENSSILESAAKEVSIINEEIINRIKNS